MRITIIIVILLFCTVAGARRNFHDMSSDTSSVAYDVVILIISFIRN